MINVAAAANESIIKKKNYNLLVDFEPVGMYAYPTNILIVNPDVPAGNVAMLIATLKARALAVTTAERLPQLPDVPTMKEAGLADFNVSDWVGFVLPEGKPVAVRDKLHSALAPAFADPQARERLRKATFLPVDKPLGPAEFGAFLRTEVDKWAKMVRDAKIGQD